MNHSVIVKLIELLRMVQTQPAMYMGRVTADATVSFCGGIWCVCYASGISLTNGIRSQATESRGWQYTSTGGVDLMREQGLTEEQIVQELLLIEIAMLELVANDLEGAPGQKIE